MIDLFLLGGMGASEEVITALHNRYNEQMGETTTSTGRKSANDDAEITKTGLEQLRKLKGKMVN